jgi:surfactin synthase thioesterase subunit
MMMKEEAIRVLCLPHAGAGASFFSPWHDLAGPNILIEPIQLPGREHRIDEPPYTDIRLAVREIADELFDAECPPARIAIFGHSFGAVLAFELARALQDQPGLTVLHLFVSGSPGPWATRESRATGLSDDEFLGRVEEFAGYGHPAFQHPELRELILPTLRADVQMHETYAPLSAEPLDVPITSFRGAADTLVSAAEAAAWRDATRGEFEVVEFPGGHMYMLDRSAELLATVADRLLPFEATTTGAALSGLIQP